MEDLVWHYTNTQGLLGILERNVLWASSCLMMNDRSEIDHGLSVAQRLWNEQRDRVIQEYNSRPNRPEINADAAGSIVQEALTRAAAIRDLQPCFVACASLEENSLSQWRSYANTGGFAIGINRHARLGVKSPETLQRGANTVATCGWFEVSYQTEAYGMLVEMCNSIFVNQFDINLEEFGVVGVDQNHPALTEFRNSLSAMLLMQSILTHKHPSFADEREVRVIVSDPRLDQLTRFRQGPYGITRYVEIAMSDENADDRGVQANPIITASGERRLPIEAICIGPTGSPDSAEVELRALLNATGYNGVEIRHSHIPLR